MFITYPRLQFLRNIYMDLFLSICIVKMYNTLFKIHEYSIDYIIDIYKQFWEHVWRLRTFQTPTNNIQQRSPECLLKYVFACIIFMKSILYDANCGSKYSPILCLFFIMIMSTLRLMWCIGHLVWAYAQWIEFWSWICGG